MLDRIELIPIKNLIGKKFCIPNYQRGYRWGRQQVRDLLDDIAEYMGSSNEVKDEFYCLQPLVVCERVDNDEDFLVALPKEPENALPITRDAIAKHVEWEVIDGQQRLTTIHILLSVLDSRQELEAKFSIRYATREGSQSFLEGIAKKNEENSINDIDFWHMFEAYKEIQDWFHTISEKSKGRWSEDMFKEVLLNKVQFIWYESNEDPIKVFTRLNIGKIGLTNSELIKALMLNRSNFEGQDADKIRLRQLEIAVKWDEIESVLQDDEFWMFLHDKGFDKPTRIDFLFNLLCELNILDEYIDKALLKNKDNKDKLLGKDGYRTFRYFNAYFKSETAKCECDKVKKSLIEVCWEKVDEIFATFREWFDDLRLYHYVGFLVDQKSKIGDIYKVWKEQKLVVSKGQEGEKTIDIRTKEAFLKDYLIPEIKTKVSGCSNLEKQYETRKSEDAKQGCRPLLLLHNIQTVINQNDRQSADGHSGVFYKFPFHLFKTEGWDIEHIDSNSENGFDEWDAKVEFLANHYNAVEGLQGKIIAFCSDPSKADNFTELRSSIENVLGKCANGDRLNPEEKNKVWNFALLDSSTNRSYGNSIFSAKRRIIIGKDKGKYIPVPRVITKKGHKSLDISSEEVDAPSSFIPPCTRQVFLKYYSAIVTSPNYWLKTDAENYKKDIFTTLKMFGVVMNDRNAKEV